jgi:hypothetical protein
MVMEHHSVEDEDYENEIVNIPKPIFRDGYVVVPDGPGLGIELNEDLIKSRLKDPKLYFPPTPEWDNERSNDRLWSLNPGGIVNI